ncbi:M14 family zinc carboxypeptidase [Pseudoalteromonas tunicata]|uniref:M14 family zinc carboxypeptidase n=1 Tax=Pseudoalteromonas tunicata TaxID=314281 RepID=UPI00273DEB90|nr:M14 family zinc carboxypeptidase [Pseudoalteromonas tunicata]MDP4983574.1 M14 family zinc carboxypeptidase [Pseudoalteromonas tunicata]
MALLSPLLFASSLFMAGVENPVYLAKFENKQQEIKTRISFHHALLGDDGKGVLLQLSNAEVLLLKQSGVSLSSADELWMHKVEQARSEHAVAQAQTSGIVGYPCYATVEETFAQAEKLANDYPDLTQWIDIGDSWQKQHGEVGFDLNVLKIGNKSLVNPPVLFIQSALHAREYATAGLTLDFAKVLLEGAKSDPDIAWILARHQIHILFQSNPDGRKIAERGQLQRKNYNENHCASSSVGVDLNRNFSFGWGTVEGGSSGEACQETYRGPSAGSEPEVAAIENYIRTLYPDVRGENDGDAAPDTTQGLYLDIHSYSRLILWPWGHTEQPSPNHQGFEALGKKLAYFNNYLPQQAVGLYPTDGTSDNLAYGELGVAHITFELGTDFFQSCSYYEQVLKPDNIEALLYAAKVVEAPYLLSQGPDIENIEPLGMQDGSISIKAMATETRFSKRNGALPMHAIAQAYFSVNAYPNQDNLKTANFADGIANSESETIIAQLSETDLIDGQATVYFKAKDVKGNVGPVSAFKIDTRLPQLQASVNCIGAKCELKAENLSADFSYVWQLPDGRTSTEKTVTFVMPQIGEQTILYQLSNKYSVQGQINLTANVTQLIEPQASFTEQCQDFICNFDASASQDADSLGLNYEWKVDNKVVSSEVNYQHDFAQAGSYDVQLQVTDEHGQISQQRSTIVLTAPVVVEPPVVVTPEVKKSGGGALFGSLTGLMALLFLRRRRAR